MKEAFVRVTFGYIGALHGWSNSLADPQAAYDSSNLGLYLIDTEPRGTPPKPPKPPGRAGALALSALAGLVRLSGESLGGDPTAERFLRRATPLELWEAIDSNDSEAVEKVGTSLWIRYQYRSGYMVLEAVEKVGTSCAQLKNDYN